MKFKVKQVIEAEFEADEFDKTLMFESISKKFEKAIFYPIEYDAETFYTVTTEDGTILKWNKDARRFI